MNNSADWLINVVTDSSPGHLGGAIAATVSIANIKLLAEGSSKVTGTGIEPAIFRSQF